MIDRMFSHEHIYALLQIQATQLKNRVTRSDVKTKILSDMLYSVLENSIFKLLKSQGKAKEYKRDFCGCSRRKTT